MNSPAEVRHEELLHAPVVGGFATHYAAQTTESLLSTLELLHAHPSPDPDQHIYDAEQHLVIARELGYRRRVEQLLAGDVYPRSDDDTEPEHLDWLDYGGEA